MRHPKRYFLPALLVLGACVAAAAVMDPVREVMPDAHGQIDWSNQVLQATGSGVRPPNAASPAQARLMAKRAAVADAYRNLAQLVSDVQVTSETTVQKFITTNDTVRLSVQAYIRGARVVEESEDPDGTYTVTLQVGMAGKRCLTGIILPRVFAQAPPAGGVAEGNPPDGPKIDFTPAPPANVAPGLPDLLEPDLLTAPDEHGPFTGLIIDARGFDVQPAMSPRIYDASGREVYGTMNVDPGYAEETGIMGYMGTIRAALTTPRVGRRPLVIRAIGTPDAFRRYITISDADAERVRAENRESRFLKNCAVTVVVDERRARDEAR